MIRPSSAAGGNPMIRPNSAAGGGGHQLLGQQRSYTSLEGTMPPPPPSTQPTPQPRRGGTSSNAPTPSPAANAQTPVPSQGGSPVTAQTPQTPGSVTPTAGGGGSQTKRKRESTKEAREPKKVSSLSFLFSMGGFQLTVLLIRYRREQQKVAIDQDPTVLSELPRQYH